MDTIWQDVRAACRTLLAARGFAAAAAATLALGVGANTAVYSLIRGVLLRPLPYANADRMFRVAEQRGGDREGRFGPALTGDTYHAWRQAPQTIDALAPYSSRSYTLLEGGEPLRVQGAAVGAEMFTLLGATPSVGRFFDRNDEASGASRAAILSDRLWRDRFQADPGAVGRVVTLDGEPYAIVGVAAPGFYFPDRDALMWTPDRKSVV